MGALQAWKNNCTLLRSRWQAASQVPWLCNQFVVIDDHSNKVMSCYPAWLAIRRLVLMPNSWPRQNKLTGTLLTMGTSGTFQQHQNKSHELSKPTFFGYKFNLQVEVKCPNFTSPGNCLTTVFVPLWDICYTWTGVFSSWTTLSLTHPDHAAKLCLLWYIKQVRLKSVWQISVF